MSSVANTAITELSRPSLVEAKSLIDHEDLSCVVERLVRVDKWRRKHAIKALQQYRRYLYLRKKYPHETLPPSYEMDEVWHAHVLHTQHYMDFCDRVFGYYLHHHPHLVKAGNDKRRLQAAFDNTQAIYQREFGEYIYRIKGWF